MEIKRNGRLPKRPFQKTDGGRLAKIFWKDLRLPGEYLMYADGKIQPTMTEPMILSDAELLKRMMTGDDQAFTALYRRHQGSVYRFALLMSGSTVLAEEVTQEVFLVLMREAQRYDIKRGSLAAYLCGVARNYVLRLLERERPYVPLLEESETAEALTVSQLIAQDDPFGECTRKQMVQLVRQAVLALPARYREVVVLCDFQEMSYAEAAMALDCAIGTVNSRLHRGHALLLQKLRATGRLDPASSDVQRLRCFV
jgi:RNA polymerase sigma-70 factor (ECF subfamily)